MIIVLRRPHSVGTCVRGGFKGGGFEGGAFKTHVVASRACVVTYLYTYVYMYTYIYIYMYTHICVYIYIYIHICMYIYIYIYINRAVWHVGLSSNYHSEAARYETSPLRKSRLIYIYIYIYIIVSILTIKPYMIVILYIITTISMCFSCGSSLATSDAAASEMEI